MEYFKEIVDVLWDWPIAETDISEKITKKLEAYNKAKVRVYEALSDFKFVWDNDWPNKDKIISLTRDIFEEFKEGMLSKMFNNPKENVIVATIDEFIANIKDIVSQNQFRFNANEQFSFWNSPVRFNFKFWLFLI